MLSIFFSNKSYAHVRDRITKLIIIAVLFVIMLIAAWFYYQPTEVGLSNVVTEQQTIEVNVIEKEVYIPVGTFLITQYCGCEKCNGKYPGLDCLGNPLEIGTIAVDTKLIPLGTTLYLDADEDGELEKYVAKDVGSMINGNHIDVYVETHDECNKKFYTEVYLKK